MNRADLRAALSHPNVAAFLRVLREGESSQDESAYTIQFGGGHFSAPPWEHPRKPITAGAWTSTAAGAYQFLAKTWTALVEAYAFPDFSPQCQDEAAVALIAGRKALDDVKAGRFDAALAKCGKEWASLPGSPYGQPTLTLEKARAIYEQWGGRYEPAPTFDPDSLATEHYDAPEVKPMAPIILPLLQVAAQFLPQLAEKFGSGSEVSNRNLAAGKVIAEAVTAATNSPNLQAAVERMQSGDKEAIEAAQVAVAKVYPELFEVGGGVETARKSAGSVEQLPFYKNSAFIFWLTVVPLIYGGVYAVLFGNGAFSDDAKMMVLTALFTGVLGAGTGFFLGSSLSSRNKDAALTGRQ